VADFARTIQKRPGDLSKKRSEIEDEGILRGLNQGDRELGKDGKEALMRAREMKHAYDDAQKALARRDQEGVQTGKLGVDLSVQMNNLRNQSRLERTAQRRVAGRNCLEIGGVWIDEEFDAKMATMTVRAQSDAYFRILERHPEIKAVFRLGNHLVWVAPNGTALVIDANDGREKVDDEAIDKLFVARK
jgi:Ca-activated chloride channel family protein